ncbi:MAG: hypothetical protein K2P81_14380 [Bacteriovoracaceae bacterium]|nr:hypothetical protein [Bacteriovoracaceae bacterium]
MALKVRVIDMGSGQVLFECPVTDSDKAYTAAAGFEALGLDVKIDHPSVNQTLANSLGIEGAPMDAFQESLAEEIEEHPGSCCFEDPKDKKIH